MSIRSEDFLLYAMSGIGCAFLSDICYGLFRPKHRVLLFLLDCLICLMYCAGLFYATVGIMQDNLRGWLLFTWIASVFVWEQTGGRLVRMMLSVVKNVWHRLMQSSMAVLRRLACGIRRGWRGVFGRLFCKINKKSKTDAKRAFFFSKNKVK